MSLAVVLVLAFATTALATSAKTWNYQEDYYSWGSNFGAGITSSSSATQTLGVGGLASSPNTNASAGGGVHSNYQTTTAKCGICHSVHRAKVGGVKLLNTDTATCAGCHIAGTSTVTEAVIAWGTAAKPLGGPHGSNGTSYSGNCSERACHAKSPHGVGGSQYGLFNAKLLNAGVDSAVAAAAANPASSGVTAALLTGAGQNMNFTGAADAVRVGYTCNQADCHVQTALAIVQAGWGEYRYNNYPLDASGKKMKTGHLSVSAIGNTAYTAASSCAGCHDQVDSATRSGYTFPHAQRASTDGPGGQTFLWYNIAGNTTDTKQPMLNANQKSFDGACLKCHRTTVSGVGITY
jgi:predicted CXXCH cytochrome family protein